MPQYGGYFNDLSLYENLKAISEIVIDDKNQRVNLVHSKSIIEQVATLFENFAVGGMTSNAFAFSKPNPVKLNQLGYGCTFINNNFNLWKFRKVLWLFNSR